MMEERKDRKRKAITRADVLERLRDCWELLDVKTSAEIQKGIGERIEYNFKLVELFIGLNDCKELSEVGAIGFAVEDEESEEESPEEEEEDE